MILLDSVAVLMIARGLRMRGAARVAIDDAAPGTLLISAVTYFEIGLLTSRDGRTRREIGDARRWLPVLVERLGALQVPITPAVAFAAATATWRLRDPADRLIVACANEHAATVMTRDRAMLAMAARGELSAIAC